MSGLSSPSDEPIWRPSLFDRITRAVGDVRDWLDARGKAAWLVAMILGFVFFWPLGLALLAYMIWSNRMFSCNHRASAQNRRRDGARGIDQTGNSAFDAYRNETLKRLEDEHDEFLTFLGRLREARDKAEFDQFMQQRRENAGQVATSARPDTPTA